MKLRKLLIGAFVGAAILVPAGAFASHTGANCNYTNTQSTHQGVGDAVIYVDTDGRAGSSGTADEAAGVCYGNLGTFEAGHSATKGGKQYSWYGMGIHDGFYAVADGGTGMPDPLDGYAGVSNYETSTTPCAKPDTCTGSNSGGNVGAPGGPYAPVPVPIMCGNTTGSSWDNSKRDGCETS